MKDTRPSKTKCRGNAKPSFLCLVVEVGWEVWGKAYFQTCTLMFLSFFALEEIPPGLACMWDISPAQGARNQQQAEGTGGGCAVALAASGV